MTHKVNFSYKNPEKNLHITKGQKSRTKHAIQANKNDINVV